MSTERYTFLSFAFDCIFVTRALINGRFLESFEKSKFMVLRTIDYLFYDAMCYIRNRYDTGDYRISDHDYKDKLYVPDPNKRPYSQITIGVRPTNYNDFIYIIILLLWSDIFTWFQRNPVICLILYIIYLLAKYVN